MRMVKSVRRASRHAACIGAAAVFALGSAACTDSNSDSTGTSTRDTAAAISAAPSGTFAGTTASGAAVRVGLINPEGGPAISEPQGRQTAEAVVKYANENLGGLGGRPIELVECRSTEDVASARACANQMVEAGVVGVVVTNTAQGDVMAPILIGAHIPYTTYQGSAPAELMAADYSYAWTGSFPAVLTGMAKYAAGANMKNVTLFATDSGSVVNGATSMGKPAFQAAGVSLEIVPIPLGNADASPQVSAGLKNSPQAVAIVGDATVCTSVLKALGTVAANAERWVIGPCLDPAVFQGAAAEINGAKVFITASGLGTDPESLTYQAIMAKYAPEVSIEGSAQTAYQSMLGFIRAAGSVRGDITAASVNTAIRSAKDVPLPIGNGAKMTCNGTAMPSLPMLCSSASNVGTINGTSVTDVKLLD